MESRLVIVVLDLNVYDKNYAAYAQLTAPEKLQKIIERTEKICQSLSKERPDVPWTIFWREQGISGAGTKFVDQAFKKKLKDELSEFTLEIS